MEKLSNQPRISEREGTFASKDLEIPGKYGILLPKLPLLPVSNMDFAALDDDARTKLGLKIQQACHRLRWTQQQLAGKAGYDEKTIRNVMKGIRVRPGCLEDICKALNIPGLDDAEDADAADDAHGGYKQSHVSEYIGLFLSYRRSFTFPQHLLRSAIEFAWDKKRNCLTFGEVQKYVSSERGKLVDYSQSGDVFISPSVGLVHLLTNHNGALRLITLTKLRSDDLTMRGTVLTQALGELHYQPSTSPIFLEKCEPALSKETVASQVGPMRPQDPEYERVNQALTSIENKVAVFALVPALPVSIRAVS